MSHTFSCLGIVLKRQNFGEADRIVTLYSLEKGKLVVLAKGVRKITSSRKSSVEPGVEAKFFVVETKNLPLLTQTSLLHSPKTNHSLTRTTQTLQILEIIDLLTVENEPNSEVYLLLQKTLAELETSGGKRAFLMEQTRLILKALGFTYDKPFTEAKLKDYIEDLGNRRLRSKPFLTVKVG